MQIGNAVPPLLAYHLGTAIAPGTAVDLFAGAGGLGLGLELAGHQVLLSVDNDARALETLRSHAATHHRAEQFDLSDPIEFRNMLDAARMALGGRELGLLAGGPPCQGFSTAGPCRVDDPRNRLVLSFLKAVEELGPENVLFENVPALRWRGKQFLDELVERLAGLGYTSEIRIIHAEAYGVPQLRRRLIVMASKSGSPRWPEPTHQLIRPYFEADQPGPLVESDVRVTVRDAIGDLPLFARDDPDQSVPLASAASDYARWLRGELSIDQLLRSTDLVAHGGQ
ncbi:hypothetical protein GCM10009617_03190 [Leifsonia poae]|uniref:DNA (cytosine-5-)-methyltransferase n=2 Tax=Leifsonia poae TaxID=110933 RepID=A0A9W6LYE8_9MICO|nr:hypothetical protein GCM10017584_03190 [Leifsonia poae]